MTTLVADVVVLPAAPVNRAWSAGARWSLAADADGLVLRRGRRVEHLGQITRARAVGDHAVRLDRTGARPLLLPLAGWDDAALRPLLAAAGVEDAWSYDLEPPVAAGRSRVLDPRRDRPLVRATVVATGVLWTLAAALVAAARPAALVLALLGATAPVAASLVARRRATAPAAGRALLPAAATGVQLAVDGDRLVAVDALLRESRIPVAGLTADALVQPGRGVLRLRLAHVDLDGPGWGERPDVVGRLRRELADLGVGWTETPVPRGATVRTLTGVAHLRASVRPLTGFRVLPTLDVVVAAAVLAVALTVAGPRWLGPLAALVLLAHVTLAGADRRSDTRTDTRADIRSRS